MTSNLLAAKLVELAPARLCALDEAAEALARAVLPQAAVVRHAPESPWRADLVLAVTAFNACTPAEAAARIHALRLGVAPALLIHLGVGALPDDAFFRALGFTCERLPDGARLARFDLATYKPAPDWLNARFWAHPERWEP